MQNIREVFTNLRVIGRPSSSKTVRRGRQPAMTIEEELLDGAELDPKRLLMFTRAQRANLRAAINIKRPGKQLTWAEQVKARWDRRRKGA